MTPRQRTQFETQLQRERTRVARILSAIAARSGSEGAPGEEGEPGAAGAGRLDDAAIAAHESAALAEINAALQVLRDTPDEYGVCVTCGQPISPARLEFVPATRYCQRHANHSRVPATA